MQKVLLLDNYDSFTYNLFHYLESFDGVEVDVYRNDQIKASFAKDYDAIVFSPGPGLPKDAGNMMEFISNWFGKKKMLGVCLGHQALAEFCGAELLNMPNVLHGVASNMKIVDLHDPLFKGLPFTSLVARYHSWTVNPQNMPKELKISAIDDAGNILALRHMEAPVWGVQFHPESILTPFGKTILFNFISLPY